MGVLPSPLPTREKVAIIKDPVTQIECGFLCFVLTSFLLN